MHCSGTVVEGVVLLKVTSWRHAIGLSFTICRVLDVLGPEMSIWFHNDSTVSGDMYSILAR